MHKYVNLAIKTNLIASDFGTSFSTEAHGFEAGVAYSAAETPDGYTVNSDGTGVLSSALTVGTKLIRIRAETPDGWAIERPLLLVAPDLPEVPPVPSSGRMAQITTWSGGRTAEVPADYWPENQAEAVHEELWVNLTTFTHTAVKSGNWNDPTVWSTGTVPGTGHSVYIGSTYTVTYNVESTNELVDILVGETATFKFARNVDTKLIVDTFACEGTFDLGTKADPITNSATTSKPRVNIIFKGTQDPGHTSRLGLVTKGKVRIWGAEKTHRITCSIAPTAGATSLALSGAPSGWRVGDKILVLSTTFAGFASTDPYYTGPTSYYGTRYDAPAMIYKGIGYKLSNDEVRTITAIIGSTVTLDSALTYNHPTHIRTLPDGQTAIMETYICNLSRSIRFEGAFFSSEKGVAGTGQHRAHTIHIQHDDVQVRWAEYYNMGRTRNDPTLWSVGNTDTTGLRASAGGAFLADPNNVIGRYPLHFHGGGAAIGRRMIVCQGNSVWAPTDGPPIPGWAIVHDKNRMAVEDNITYHVRGAGIVSEIGKEIGQWIGNVSAWNVGDGYSIDWGQRQESTPSHNGHCGTAYECQARQVIQQDNIASSSHVGWMYFAQQWEGFNHPIVNNGYKSPDDKSLRFYDPVTLGQQGEVVSSGPSEDDNTYGPEQPQIPDFKDNWCLDVDQGFTVARRDFLDNMDQIPMVASGFRVLGNQPYRLINYSYDYIFKDFFFKGPNTTDNYAAINIGTKAYSMSFSNGVIDTFKYAVYDETVNYNGFLTDIARYNVPNIQRPYISTLETGLDPTAHNQYGIMGPWALIGSDAGNATVKIRQYDIAGGILNSTTDLPVALPAAPFGITTEPLPGTPKPYFYLSPGGSYTVTYGGKGQLQFTGILVDSIGVRRWPDGVKYVTNNSWGVIGKRSNGTLSGQKLVERNACYLEDGVWKTYLWFVDADRLTGEYIVFGFPVVLSGFPLDFLARHQVIDANATKPTLPLPLEDISIVNETPDVRSSPAAFAFNALIDRDPATDYASNTITVVGMTAGASAAVTITDGLYSKNGGAYTSSPGTAKQGDTFTVKATSGASGAVVNAVLTIGSTSAGFSLTTATFSPTYATFADYFDRTAENLEANAKWQLIDGAAGSAVIASNRLNSATADSAGASYKYLEDIGSGAQWVEFTAGTANNTSLAGITCLRFTDRDNFIGAYVNGSSVVVVKRVAGVQTTITTLSGSNAAGALYRLDVDGTAYSVKINGSTLGSGTITGSLPPASNYAGIFVRSPSGSAASGFFGCGVGPKNSFGDRFNRSNQNLEASANWTRVGGTTGMGVITSQSVYSTTADGVGALYLAPNMGYTKQAVGCYMNTSFAPGGIAICATDENNYIELYCVDGSNVRVRKRISGVTSTVATIASSYSGYNWMMTYEKDTKVLTVYRDFTQIWQGTITVSPPYSTRTGIIVKGGIKALIDEFYTAAAA